MMLYKKHQEIIDYLFWGGVAFVLSMALYWILITIMGPEYSVVANTIDWVICVIFTYFTNRKFVFKSKVTGKTERIKEFGEFVAARAFTLVLENLIIFIGVDLLHFESTIQSTIVKLIGQMIVIITNYILSKLWIFKKKENESNEHEQ